MQMVDVLVAAGVRCRVEDVNQGWETRARSSGGFASPPKGCVWHHTASSTSPHSDLSYMIDGSPDAPIGNLLLDRDGIVWPIAAGGANTQGKGGPSTFSRGTVPVDSGNSQLFGLEVANSGTGEPWPQIQIDAYFKTSNALNAMFGNLPTDLITHHEWAPDRKIDPAKATEVEGPWSPGAINSSGTWSGDDVREECSHRAVVVIPPQPKPPSTEETDMLALDFGVPGVDDWWTRLTYTGAELVWVVSPADQLQDRGGVRVVGILETELNALLDTVQTVGPSPTWNNQGLTNKWEAARGRT